MGQESLKIDGWVEVLKFLFKSFNQENSQENIDRIG